MARLFVTASTTKIVFTPASYPISAYPFDMHVWITSGSTVTNTALNMADVSSDIVFQIVAKRSATPVIQISSRNLGGQVNAIGTTDLGSAGTVWHSLIGEFVNNTDRAGFVDGVQDATNIGDEGFGAGTDVISIGALERLNPVTFWEGDISQAAIWNVNLTATSKTALANGVNPFVIQNTSLVFYCPVDGNLDPEPDYMSTDTGVITNSPAKSANNPPVELLENYL